MKVSQLTYEKLYEAVAGNAYAFRAVVDFYPVGGDGDKVFPPTYSNDGDTVYAFETRIIDGEELKCVLLDSVQSQANRLELALLDWHRNAEGEPPFPLVEIDFRDTKAKKAGVLTALEAPHRIYDAYFRNAEIFEKGKWIIFRSLKSGVKCSELGRELGEAKPSNATPIFKLCPTGLIFGMWDSYAGGLGAKFQRVLVSEIVGVGVTEDNRRPESRIDPLIGVAGESVKVEEGPDCRVIMLKQSDKGGKKLSEVGLGNVTPSLKKDGKYLPGGVTFRFARQIAVLSLPALRRLRFPLPKDGKVSEKVNVSARTTLAALALAALTRQWEQGFSLRSRCDLAPKPGEKPYLALLAPDKEERFELTFMEAAKIAKKAADEARKSGLPWPTTSKDKPWENGVLRLRPTKELVEIILCSWELAGTKKGKGS